ncbi:EEF1A lysine methyltransferase 3-like [Chiloscyllium plagiosum]|uniref:EEF1A lysine methyltransferase 3-like n=1 Tax=Chiloscyllium plagiosum TaxID=36176 RepID=UPI001CB7D955|nr:EEF1A lysine methyltransferase 3-like [Chiloscyllium plagiosum]
MATKSQGESNDHATKEGDTDNSMVILENAYQFCGFNLKINRFINANLGYSAYVWDAGIFLCQYFEKENINFIGKKVIELGSGTGIVGILTTLLGGDVTITDKSIVMKQIDNNIVINVPAACRHRIKARPLIWGEDHTNFPTGYDFILGSDITYSSMAHPALLETLCYLSRKGTTIYLCSEIRTKNGSLSFQNEFLPQYFNCQVLATSESKDIILHKFTRIGGSSPGDGAVTGNK